MNQQTSISHGLNCTFGGGPTPSFFVPASFFFTLVWCLSTSFSRHLRLLFTMWWIQNLFYINMFVLFTQLYEILTYSYTDVSNFLPPTFSTILFFWASLNVVVCYLLGLVVMWCINVLRCTRTKKTPSFFAIKKNSSFLK